MKVKMKGWIIGNGPSKNEWDYRNLDGIVYGCNSLYKDCFENDWLCDYLVVCDPWYQFEVVASEYPLRGKCLFFNYHPVPYMSDGLHADMLDPSVVMSETLAAGYDQYEHNPQHKAIAKEWLFYATSAEDYERAVERGSTTKYWGPNKQYICWVPEGSLIAGLTSDVLKVAVQEEEKIAPPAGAWALEHALFNDVIDTIEIIGFDALAGTYSTTSNWYSNDHDNKQYGTEWKKIYDSVIEASPKKDIIWHTKKD